MDRDNTSLDTLSTTHDTTSSYEDVHSIILLLRLMGAFIVLWSASNATR